MLGSWISMVFKSINTVAVTDSHFCVLTSSDTHNAHCVLLRNMSGLLTPEIFILAEALALTLSVILSLFSLVK